MLLAELNAVPVAQQAAATTGKQAEGVSTAADRAQLLLHGTACMLTSMVSTSAISALRGPSG